MMKKPDGRLFPPLDKSGLSIRSLRDETTDLDYWFSKSPAERIAHIELLRMINYGDQASSRLQRFFEVAELL